MPKTRWFRTNKRYIRNCHNPHCDLDLEDRIPFFRMTFRLMVVHHNTRLGYKRWQTNTQPSGNKYVLRALHPSPPKTPQCFPYFSKIRHHTQRKKRPRVGRWSWAAKVGLLLLRVVQVVRQQQCNGHCLCDCPSTAVETVIAQCTGR